MGNLVVSYGPPARPDVDPKDGRHDRAQQERARLPARAKNGREGTPMTTLIWFGAFVAFVLLDCWLYMHADDPNWKNNWWYLLPGGGLIAYLRFGPTDD